MSQNPVIRIHLLKIRLYRIFTSLESSLQICFAITYCLDGADRKGIMLRRMRATGVRIRIAGCPMVQKKAPWN